MKSDAWAGALLRSTCKYGFPIIQASSCAQHPSNVLELPGKTVCLPSDHVIQIHDGQCLSNQKTKPTSPWSLTNSSVLFLVKETLSPSTATTASWFQHHIHKPMPHLLLAWILYWRDASEVFQSKFDSKILCWCPLRQQLLRQLNDFHESQHELSRHGHCLLMWKVAQAWDLHRPTYCPL